MMVYLSSTLSDLADERVAVKEALGGECVVVESYVADERSLRDSCLDDVSTCDLYVAVIGRRYGFVPPGETLSITELEYEQARNRLPMLIFVKEDPAITVPHSDAHTGEHPPERIDSFRKRLNSGSGDATRPTFFKTPAELKSHVLKAYFHHVRRIGAPKPERLKGRPYPGLRAFLPADADRFFGRDAEIDELVDRLLGRGQRFVVVTGPSGSGKSSLMYAGLIPKLTASPVLASGRWVPVSFSPRKLGDDPFLAIAQALNDAFQAKRLRVPDLARDLRSDPSAVAAFANEALGDQPAGAELLLFVDQFEEIFATKVDGDLRHRFFRLLFAGAACPRVRVVVAMRSDFYGQWPQDEALISVLNSGHFTVGMPGQAALKEMIVGPAEAAGIGIKPQLVQRILDDTGTAPGALALVEYALSQLYEKRERQSDSVTEWLTEAAYETIGGVSGAIETLAETAVRRAEGILSATGKALDEADWSRLLTAIASVEVTGDELAIVRRRALQSQLSDGARVLADHLVDERILVSSKGQGEGPAVYEVAHEAVFGHWRRCKDWYARYADDLALVRQAERAASDWERAACSPALRWAWERQRPVLEALHKLGRSPPCADDPEFSDANISSWQALKDRLPESPVRSFLKPEPLALVDELGSDDTPHHRREEIGWRLNQLGDPRRGVGLDAAGLPDIAWVGIPPAMVALEIEGSATFEVKRFRLARYPITWAQYRAFLAAPDGYIESAWWQTRPREHDPGNPLWTLGNYPAINVSWWDATAYCRWLGSHLGLDIRLPTEWEWQWAATGNTHQEYPWPGGWNASRANCDGAGIGRTVAVGLYPRGRSPFGVDDMAGNVYEWCSNEHADPRNVDTGTNAARALRGGSWDLIPHGCRAAGRDNYSPANRVNFIGYRVCCS